MSVYNRKMFKRNAREKLNQTAGIQTFQQGGQVSSPYFPVNQPAPFSGIQTVGSPIMSEEQYYRLNPAAATRKRIFEAMRKPVPPVPQTNVLVDQARTTAPSEPLPQTISDFLRTGQGQTANLLKYGLTPLTPADRIPGEMPGERAEFLAGGRDMGEFAGVMEQIEKGPPRPSDTDLQDDPSLVATEEEEKTVITPEAEPTVEETGREAAIREGAKYGTAEEVKQVIEKGTPEEQQKTLEGFIQEFMDQAPGYESADSGLVMAKIGFAMAAGDSPDAIQNIATAMSDGADMMIKDKAKKDEFNRQLKLSALQYGLQETSKISAEDRALGRARADVVEMVVGEGGTLYKGKEYKKGESIFISKGEIQDGALPENIISTGQRDALINQAKATKTSLDQALKLKQITPEQYDKQMEKYSNAVTDAIDAEAGIALLEGAMVTTAEGNVTGLSGVVSDAILKGGAFFGMDLSKEYGSKEEVRNAMRAALQDVVPVTLGSTQSANSISNRDIDFLIEAYFGQGALDGGMLTFAAQNETQMVKRLQRAADKMRKAQKDAFATMQRTEKFLEPLYQPGTLDSAVGILETDKERLRKAGLAAGGGEDSGVFVGGKRVQTTIGATRGDDGIIRYNLE